MTLALGDYYVGYFCGAFFNLNFRDLTRVDSKFYNRDNGDGKFEAIVARLKAK